MKKFLASILCFALMLSTMSFGVVAEIQHPERSIEVTASTDELYAGETVTIDVIVKGDDLANAEWTLEYNKDYFELTGSQSEGEIEDYDFIRDGGVYTDGQILKSYTFTALAQTEEVTANFKITSAHAYTYLESIWAYDIDAGTNSVPVTILLYDYDISAEFDGDEITSDEISLPYDNENHTFEVITDPSATVTYWVNGEQVSNIDNIKEEGTYNITYKVESPEIGFAPVEETFTVVIASPEYVLEVGAEDYVAGYKIVLAYTNTPGVFFNYDSFPMTDVSERGYTYEGKAYDRVFAFVIDASTGTTEDDFKSCVSHTYDGTYTKKVDVYDADLNLNGELTIQDITVGFGVYNTVPEYFQSDLFQVQILKTDIIGDKVVRPADTTEIINKVLYPQN